MNDKFAGILIAIVLIVMTGVVASKNFNVNVDVPEQTLTYGATPGSDFSGDTVTFNGVPQVTVRTGFYTASSTLCSIKSPAFDSQLSNLSVTFTSLPAYATQYMFGMGTINATTTSLIAVTQMAYAASGTGTSIASSTAQIHVPANTHLNLKLSTTTASATYAPVGRCSAQFIGA